MHHTGTPALPGSSPAPAEGGRVLPVEHPLLSVCIPVYNCERFIGAAIESVLAQTRQDFELVILNNCSTDRTAEVIRRYDDPRIHFAANCASIGCPMLREEAYVGARLDAQLDEQAQRFMSDRSRNRYDAGARGLALSSIFDWYGKDFSRGWKGYKSLEQWLARYADQLADRPEERAAIRAGKQPVSFLDYDWRLNDAR